MNPLRILWLNSDKAGCGAYRTYIPALTLESEGYDNNFLEHRGTPADGSTMHEDGNDLLSNIDVVVFQRAIGARFVSWMQQCRARGIATVVELDDDLFNVPKHNPASGVWRRPEAQEYVRKQLLMADHVIASTVPLANQLASQARGIEPKTTVCRNHLHPTVWPQELLADDPVHQNPEGSIVVGWQGSQTHDDDFRIVIPALMEILRRYPQVILRFFGSVPLTIRGKVPENRFQWVHGVPFDRYPATLRYMNFDVAIAPLVDCAFNRAKSHLKWMEYASLGLPVVASDVYPYANAIVHGSTGFTCRSDDEWIDTLSMLIEDAALRQHVGGDARQHVINEWYPDKHIGAWKMAFEAAVAAAQGVAK